LVIYGDEPWEPYDRVRLSALLTGKESLQSIQNRLQVPEKASVRQFHNCAVVNIDRTNHRVIDVQGRSQRYSKLVLAVGSKSHIPQIPGIHELDGIYRFRDMSDAERLIARTTRSRYTLVLGGGLLGIEAARGLCRSGTAVTIVEHSERLMAAQLDNYAAELIKTHVQKQGIKVITGNSVKTLLGKTAVKGVLLRDGQALLCDTLVVATGIRANIELARKAGLPVGRGIKVNEYLQTADKNIYAIGECVEYKGNTYGLVKPSLDQADVLAAYMSGSDAVYMGSTATSRLKVVEESVFSAGNIGQNVAPTSLKKMVWKNDDDKQYRKILFRHNRIVGAIGIGPWQDNSRLQEAIEKERRIGFWQQLRFKYTGSLWSGDAVNNVASWPENTYVCNCKSVTKGDLSVAMEAGCKTVEALAGKTGASTVCGSCKPLLANLVGGEILKAESGSKWLMVSSIMGSVLSLIFFAYPGLPFNVSVTDVWRWDILWRNETIKQISGFSLLSLSVMISAISIRKRVKRVSSGSFSAWRLFHVISGIVILGVLVAHTGFRMGVELNFWLMLSFVVLVIFGSLSSLLVAYQHKLDNPMSRKTKSLMLWGHILLLWPLPSLVIFHVIKTYWY